MKVRSYICILIALVSLNVFSQVNPLLDSLKLELKKANHDSVRCRILGQMVDNDFDDKTWPLHNKNQLTIALKYVNDNIVPKSKQDTVFFNYLLTAYSNEGFVCINAGDFKKALEFFNRVIKLHSKVGNEAILASVYNNIAGVHINEGNNSTALEYFFKSLDVSIKSKDKYYTGKACANIAKYYDVNKDYKKAMEYSIRAKDIYTELNDRSGLALVYNNLGRLYRIAGDIKSELEYCLKAYEINKEIGEKRGQSYSANSLSIYYNDIKNTDLAYKYGLEAYNLGVEVGYPEVIKSQAYWMYQLEAKKGNWKAALDYHLTYHKMKDSLETVANTKAALEQKVQFEYDKQKAIDQTKHTKELEIASEKEKKQRVVSFSIGFGLLLVIIFSIIIFNRLRITHKQKLIIEKQKLEVDAKNEIIEEKQKEIIDSINYAKRIQYSLLAHAEFLKQNLPDHFTFFYPKDIVSGDFYWATKHNDKFYLAVCDSTGHGVPGAFMSLLNIGFLSEAINEKNIEMPNQVFDYVRMKLTATVSREGQKDGFDGILICFDQKKNSITYAAANNAPVLIQGHEIKQLPNDRMPVGIGERKENFPLFTITAKPGDVIYFYTDGYCDQFGGPKGKKFKSKQLNELLLAQYTKPFEEQYKELKTKFTNWKGELEQIDDVCVLGIRI